VQAPPKGKTPAYLLGIAATPVQPDRSRVKRGMDASLQKSNKPVQTARSWASGGMDAANRSRPAVDREGMEPRDGYTRPEGQVS